MLFALLLLFISCENKKCVLDQGTKTSYELEIHNFYGVKFLGMFDIHYYNDTNRRIVLEGGEKLLENVSTEWESTRIKIYNNNTCGFARKYERIQAHVYSDDLGWLITSGACSVTTHDTIKTNRLEIVVHNEINEMDIKMDVNDFIYYNNSVAGGIYYFNGSAKKAWIEAHASVKLNIDILSEDMFVKNSSVVDVNVRTDKLLRAELNSNANIYYYGNPDTIIMARTGNGNLIHVED